jgi:hypothetical protein
MKTTMKFKMVAGKKTYSGNFIVPDDDGTATLPMMLFSLVRSIANDRPEIHSAKKIEITAELEGEK